MNSGTKLPKEHVYSAAVQFVPFYVAGMFAAYFFSSIINSVLFAAAAVAAVFLIIKKKRISVCFAGAAAGIVLMTLHMLFYVAPVLAYSESTIIGEFLVCETGRTLGGSAKYTVSARLGGRRSYVSLQGGSGFEEGDIISAEIELYKADEYYLPYNLSRNVLLSGNIKTAKLKSSGGRPIRRMFESLRRGMIGRTVRLVGGKEGALAAAVLFGDGGLSAGLFEQLKVSGAAHYTAVSGAHFAVLAAVLTELMPSRNRRLKAVTGIAFAVVGVLFFGTSGSVLRAAAMLVLNSASGLFMRRSEQLNTLCCSVFLLTLFQPQAILDTGFEMSVLGVLGVGIVGENIAGYIKQIIPASSLSLPIDILSRSMCACICTSPISAALFKGCSAAGAITTVILAPLVTCGMIFAALASVLNSPIAAIPVYWAIKLTETVVSFAGNKRALWITLDIKGAWILPVLSAALLVIMALGGFKAFLRLDKFLELTVLCSMIISLVISRNRCEVRFAGNTNSAAAVIINGTHTAVFVAGTGENTAESVLQCMREHGAQTVDAVIFPEAGLAGAAALSEMSEAVKIGRVYSNHFIENIYDDVNIVSEYAYITVDGKVISSDSSADIVLLTGSLKDIVLESGQTAVYFTSTEKNNSPNVHNARRERDFSINLQKIDN